MELSHRSYPGGAENALSRALRARRARGEPVLDLTCSNPARAGLRHDAQAVASALAEPPVEHVPDPWGDRGARQAVCAYLDSQGVPSDPDHTLLTASTSEAYGLLFKLLCDPGDRVLAPAPSYPLFEVLARLEGVELLPYPLRYDGRWHLDLPALREAARAPRVRAALVVSPNNPTGNRLTHEELSALGELSLPLISDEVFAEYGLRDEPSAASTALGVSDRCLVFRMGGLSKSALLPQAKLAWTTLAGPAASLAMARERLEHLADAYLSPSAFVQHAVGPLLASAAPLRERTRARLADNLRRVQRSCEASAVSPLHVEAGWYATLRLPAVLDEEAWALALLEAGVLVQPGYFYELSSGPHAVLSLLNTPEVLQQGLEKLLACVERTCA